jgi:hypothetical protein
MLNLPQALPAPGGFLTEYDGIVEHFSLPKMRIIQYHEDAATSDKDEVAPSYDPHHSWSSPPPEQQISPNQDSPTTGSHASVPRTLRQHATDHYARLDHVQRAPKPVQSKKLKGESKTKRRLSSESLASDSETVPSPKRLRRAKAAPSPPRRQLRSGGRKSARNSEKSPS